MAITDVDSLPRKPEPPSPGVSLWQVVTFGTPLLIGVVVASYALTNRVTLLESGQREQGEQIRETNRRLEETIQDNKDRDKSMNAVLQRLERIESKQDSGNERLRELLSRK